MIAVLVHQDGRTQAVDHVDPTWLQPGAAVRVWVDITTPTEADGRLLSEVFGIHPLAIEDAMSAVQFPKVERYGSLLYLVLHGIDARAREHRFTTRDVDFFLGATYLVTVHDGASRSLARVTALCGRHGGVLGEGPVALLHRIVDAMVDNYRPEVEAIEARITRLEEQAFTGHDDVVRPLLTLKRDLSMLRRIVIPQRDAVGRLSRREFEMITDEMTYRFRDVFDQLVRIADEAVIFQDRVNGILEAHLSAVSNRLNQVMKVLTVLSTIFMPLTVLTGMWGMNVGLPHLPGGETAQFWWVLALMCGMSGAMLLVFRRKGWW